MKKVRLLKFIIISLIFTSTLSLHSEELNISSEDTFTINYENVALSEYVKFVSKVCKVNFIYNIEDLNYTISVLSKEAVTKDNVMSTLIQILRIHSLNLIEEDNNLIISKNPDVKELAQVIVDNKDAKDPIVTRIFKINNVGVENLSAILRPMISAVADIEISMQTRHLIVTDVISNISKIADLIDVIDSDENPLDIKTYISKKNLPSTLMNLTKQIMQPLIEGSPFILVPQDRTRILFLVSTPSLIKRALSILENLDTAPKKQLKSPENENILLYSPKNRSYEDIKKSLNEIVENLKRSGFPESGVIETIDTLKWIKETQSFLFIGSDETILKVQNILKNLDSPLDINKNPSQSTFFLYKLKNIPGEVVEDRLEDLAKNLKEQDVENPKLIEVIEKAKWIKETNSILLTGESFAINEAKNIITEFDIPSLKESFILYTPKFLTIDDLEKSINEVARNLKAAGLADPDLIDSIKDIKIIKSSNSLAFTGSESTLKKIQNLISTLDIESSRKAIQKLGTTNFWVYQIRHATPSQILSSIKSVTRDLSKIDSSSRDFIGALKSMKYVKETNSLVFTGTEDSLEKIKPLIEKFDILSEKEGTSYFVYKPQYQTGPELENILTNFAEHLKQTGVENDAMFEAISTMKYSKETNSLVFTGNIATIDEVKQLLLTFDVPDMQHPGSTEISGLEDLGFLVYKLQYHKGSDIQGALKQIAKDLKLNQGEAGVKFKLVKAIDTIQWIAVTNSLLCSGDSETTAKLRELIKSLDVPLKQVFIEVLIIQTTLSNVLSFGLDWGSKFGYKNQAVAGISNFAPGSSFGSSFGGISNSNTPQGSDLSLGDGFDFGVIGDILFHKGKSFLSLGSLLRALQVDTETSIVMTPKIIAQDSKTSTIFSGSNIPYLGSVTTNTSNTTLTTQNLEYRDVGLGLTITPVLGNSDQVTLTIDLTSTQIQPGTDSTIQSGQVTGITTLKTTMNTAVHVPNKHFLVLSGLVQDTKQKVKTGIPCLGGIPIIGSAFSKDDKSDQRNNIVIFIRPHIINSYQDLTSITENQEDLFRDQTGSSFLENTFDEATDTIKAYEVN
ncbi:MAG: putative type II secretion system protein D [Candidatus Anoxychlamydiales bacterium]|nr:putative type II secretion system protein D [Candidatus Anoxychlamydiales bacterium]